MSLKQMDLSGDSAGVANRWIKWKRSFMYFIEAKGITGNTRKKAVLLHSIGPEVQEIFEHLPDVAEDINEFEKTLKKLDNYFSPQKNVVYERFLFRQLRQEVDETIDQFTIRLRRQAEGCDFHNTDECVRDQIIESCHSPALRRK